MISSTFSTHFIVMSLSGIFFLYVSVFGVYGRHRSDDCPADAMKPWSYRGSNGPRHWGETYPDCNGKQQSPINIVRADVQDANLANLTLNNYEKPITNTTILNNGYTIEVDPHDGINRTISVDGVEYSLQQFHFHWGDAFYIGSEHAVDDKKYAMEMHLVHMSANNQIAVVGVFFQQQADDNEELQKIIEEFPFVKYEGDESELQSNINLNNLLPGNPASFYRYQGSLTTPPCTEGVTWSVIKRHVPVGKAQMEKFRHKLYSVKKEDARKSCKLVNNYRPLQPLNGREVHAPQ